MNIVRLILINNSINYALFMYAWAQLVCARSDFTSKTSIRYNSVFSLASRQIQAIQSQKTRLELDPV